MSAMVEIQANGLKQRATCAVEPSTKAGATKKGLKVFAYTWIGALLTIPIPIVHFVTVPAAVLLGPLLGYLIYRSNLNRATIRCPEATCPACRHELPLTFASDVSEIERTCKSCGASLAIKVLTAASS